MPYCFRLWHNGDICFAVRHYQEYPWQCKHIIVVGNLSGELIYGVIVVLVGDIIEFCGSVWSHRQVLESSHLLF